MEGLITFQTGKREQIAAFAAVWTTWNRKDFHDSGTGSEALWGTDAQHGSGAELHRMIVEFEVVRQQIQDFASTQSISFGAKSAVKLILLDEADAMTKDAQFALRRVIEKYTKNTRFSLICNNVNKVIPALQSRCTRFRFAPLDAVHVTERLKHVISAEGLDVPENGLKAVRTA
ncbi:Replication factor C subunit 5 [Forsythia ovata]|uniref:Replication factor C subunit 5 n=1 Tax=Forsythia ovata TaxID=205694 RepID=A0ABD1PUY9_9LAMI